MREIDQLSLSNDFILFYCLNKVLLHCCTYFKKLINKNKSQKTYFNNRIQNILFADDAMMVRTEVAMREKL